LRRWMMIGSNASGRPQRMKGCRNVMERCCLGGRKSALV
jgi:hypothetical protein